MDKMQPKPNILLVRRFGKHDKTTYLKTLHNKDTYLAEETPWPRRWLSEGEDVPTPAISPNVANTAVSFVVVGDCIPALPHTK